MVKQWCYKKVNGIGRLAGIQIKAGGTPALPGLSDRLAVKGRYRILHIHHDAHVKIPYSLTRTLWRLVSRVTSYTFNLQRATCNPFANIHQLPHLPEFRPA